MVQGFVAWFIGLYIYRFIVYRFIDLLVYRLICRFISLQVNGLYVYGLTCLQVYKVIGLKFEGLQVYRLTCLQCLQVKGLQVYKFTGLQINMFTGLQVYRFTGFNNPKFKLFRFTSLYVYLQCSKFKFRGTYFYYICPNTTILSLNLSFRGTWLLYTFKTKQVRG